MEPELELLRTVFFIKNPFTAKIAHKKKVIENGTLRLSLLLRFFSEEEELLLLIRNMFKNIFGSNPGETAKERLASALEKTSEVLSNKAKEYENDRQIREKQEKDGNENEEKNANPVNFGKIFGSVVSATKKHVADAQQLGNQIQSSATSIFKKGDYRRDLSLPLDVEALRDAEVVYVTDRIITMGHPFMQSSTDGDITPQRKLAAVGHLLNKRHAGRYMVWNLSEVEYDYSMLDDEVLPFCFPGTPSPPLGMLLKLLLSIESWLKADSRNIAVIHCLTGKGRTSTGEQIKIIF